MPVEIDIAYVAKLARLDLSPDELEGYRSQLSVILDHAARVQSLKGEPEPDVTHPLGLVNAFREDEIKPSLDRDEVLAASPESRDGYFVVPPALES
jgi:aspartyl-tRNA(Asn)/glutamyl-tRNA(Gln) amidotransferase subunit C